MDTLGNSDWPVRKRTRLYGYDYSVPGSYFITACTQGRLLLFGRVVGSEMAPSPAGTMIEKWWLELGTKYTHIELDRFRVMPNHIHGVIRIMEAPGSPQRRSPTLDEMYGWFSTMTTNDYIRGVKENGWERYEGRLWQRGFYDHIIRNEEELSRIRYYIENNPGRWSTDAENPVATARDEFDLWLDSVASRPDPPKTPAS